MLITKRPKNRLDTYWWINKPNTPADKQVLTDLFGECYVYHFAVNGTEPTCVETKPAGKHSTTPVTKTKPARKLQAIT